MNIAIIPARGGSKRIPRKNIKLFHGLPVIAYAIKTAQESRVFKEIYVSTDDEEIATIAKSFGAQVPRLRSEELSNDFATTVSVIKAEVMRLKSEFENIQNVCCIYPATPLLESKLILKGLEILETGDWNYVFPGVQVGAPAERLLTLGTSGEVNMTYPEHIITRTQDLPRTFYDAGQFYWGKALAWESGLPIFSSSSTILEMPRDLIVDIDTLEDWHHAERLFESSIRE